MATQRIALAKVGGVAGTWIAERFRFWLAPRQGDGFPEDIRDQVDGFAEALRANSAAPPVVYFSEWVDMWSMGDVIPGLEVPGAAVVAGRRFELCCHRFPIIPPTRFIGDEETQESQWLAARLSEAQSAWEGVIDQSILLVLREPLSGSLLDEELSASTQSLPSWLAVLTQ